MVSSRKLSSEEVDALIEGLQSDESSGSLSSDVSEKLQTLDHTSLGQMSYLC